MYDLQLKGRIEYNNSKSYTLDSFSDKKIEKNIKVYMLDVLKYNAKYYYSTAIKYYLPYPKLYKKSYTRLMKIMSKCVNDFHNYTKKIDALTLFNNKGIL